MAIELDREALAAAWRRMDADAAAQVLRSTTWSHLTGDQQPARLAAEPLGTWDDEAESASTMSATRRATIVAARLLTHDPRFAGQLQKLWGEPFSDDFQEFVHLLIEAAAEAGAAYARHLDSDPPLDLERAVRATAALLGTEVLPDAELVLLTADGEPSRADTGRSA